MPNVLESLQIANILRNKEWDPDSKLTPLFFSTELAGEVGELCNVVKKLERERLHIRGSRATREDLMDELADVVICVSLLANAYGIDLPPCVVRKFNATSKKIGLDVTIGEE